MRSRASFKGHPLHAVLVNFPIAFVYGAIGFDLLGVALSGPSLWTTGRYLGIAAVLTALAAALPGLVDYFFTVPPRSSAKDRATKHMVINLSWVALMGVAVGLRWGSAAAPGAAVLLLEAVSAGLVTVGGWMGGTLVVRNQIGVEHLYADAGTWLEARFPKREEGQVNVGRADALKPGQMKLLHMNGNRIVLARTESGWAAFEDACPHKGASLADGALIGDGVQCPWHGSQFDVRSGELLAGPAVGGIKSYPVEERGGTIYLRFPLQLRLPMLRDVPGAPPRAPLDKPPQRTPGKTRRPA